MANNTASSVATALVHYSSNDAVRNVVFATFAALAWYNAIELVILCLVTFRCWHGCYFWSLLISSSCIITYCLGFVLLFFPTGVTPYVCVTLVVISWCGMVTGQSLVLWSRLHLVVQNTKLLLGVLLMIVVDAVILHIPTAVLFYGTAAKPNSVFAHGYNIMERIQIAGFCIQELIISGIYVWQTIKLLRLRPQGRPLGILSQLLVINIVILMLDITVIVIEYIGYYAVQVMFKPVAYSVKLKLEYAILGKLVSFVRRSYDISQELPSSAQDNDATSSLPSSWNLTSRRRSGRKEQSLDLDPSI
jgi:hypothetical protein